MATIYSDQMVKIRAGRSLNPTDSAGKLRIEVWDFASLAAGTLADVLVCFKLYKDERILFGREFHSALTSGAGTATGSYGTYAVGTDGITLGAVDDVDRYLTPTSFEAAGQNDIASLQAAPQGVGTGPLHVAASDLFVCCTNTGEAFATAGRISGYAVIVKD